MNYILGKNRKPIKEPDLVKWARWMKEENRKVGRTRIGKSLVSTVFLGTDHNLQGRGAPILWETMVFGGPLSMQCTRCKGSWENAEAMHEEMCHQVRIHE